jgi:energy-coupling factor transporter transmembrane protein EcfT
MEGDEYLEKIVTASYAREIDQEENIFRTLPFAATALAIIFTFMVFIKGDVPNRTIGIYLILIWILLFIFWLVIAFSLVFLWLAVSSKSLQFLSPPNELYRYVTELRNYYSRGYPARSIEQRVVEDARTLMVEQYTLGAIHNQRINVRRLRARTRAFQGLIAALIVALATVAIVLGHKLARGGGCGAIAIQQWR